MKTYRQREKQGTKTTDSTKGPDEAKIKILLDRTGYTLDVTTGQRKYGGPPPESVFSGAQPTVGTEVQSSHQPVNSKPFVLALALHGGLSSDCKWLK